MSRRDQKITELLSHLAAKFFQQESNGKALITVTGCTLVREGNLAIIYLSIYPEQHIEEVLAFARRKRTELREYIKANSSMNNIPGIEIAQAENVL